MSKITTVLTNLETALKTITTDNGYNFDVTNVDKNFVLSDSFSSPALLPLAGEPIVEEMSGGVAFIKQIVTIYYYIKDATATPTLQTKMLELREDITKCLGLNETLSDACDRIIILDGAGPAGDVFEGGYGYAPGYWPPFCCGKVPCQVEYQEDLVNGF